MTGETNASPATGSTMEMKFPLLAYPEWLKPLYAPSQEAYAARWHHSLEMTAAHLQDQTDYIRHLSKCTDPAEALKELSDFAAVSWKRWLSDASTIMKDFHAPATAK